jgi:hypothetical protein
MNVYVNISTAFQTHYCVIVTYINEYYRESLVMMNVRKLALQWPNISMKAEYSNNGNTVECANDEQHITY